MSAAVAVVGVIGALLGPPTVELSIWIAICSVIVFRDLQMALTYLRHRAIISTTSSHAIVAGFDR